MSSLRVTLEALIYSVCVDRGHLLQSLLNDEHSDGFERTEGVGGES